MSPTSTSIKSTFWQRIIEAWPILAAMAGIAVTWHVQIHLIDYRLNKAEQEITNLRVDAKENLEKLATSVQKLQLDVQTLVTLMHESNGDFYGPRKN